MLVASVGVAPAVMVRTALAVRAGTTPGVSRSLRNDTSAPLRATRAGGPPSTRRPREPGPLPRPAARVTSAPSPASRTAAPRPWLSRDGLGDGFAGPQGRFTVDAAPSDSNGAAGPRDYVEVVNTSLAVFDRYGRVRLGPITLNTVWTGFGGLCETDNDGDPVVRYDRLADRWVLLQFAVTGADGDQEPYLVCMAVSVSGDPTGSYHRYAFGYSDFPDYPKLAIWPDGYYLTVNLFSPDLTSFLRAAITALDRDAMLRGEPVTAESFLAPAGLGGVLGADLSGPPPPAGSPEYLLALGAEPGTLTGFTFHVDFANPDVAGWRGPLTLPVRAFGDACGDGECVPQPGTDQPLDGLGDRLMYRVAYRNAGDHESLVVAHSVDAGSATGVRWYELRIAGGTPRIYQQGTYAPDGAYRWLPAVAIDHRGDIAIAFNVSGPAIHPGVRIAGRAASDPPGTMGPETGVVDGRGSQTSGLTRWGDYSSLDVDPGDDCTFWLTGQYIAAGGAFNWRTRIAAFRFPSCYQPPPVAPCPLAFIGAPPPPSAG
jgi:hypothetical protein